MKIRLIVVSAIVTCCLVGCPKDWPKTIVENGVDVRVKEAIYPETPKGYVEFCVSTSSWSTLVDKVEIDEAFSKISKSTDVCHFQNGHWECTGSVNPQEISWRGVWSLWNVEAASSVKRVREESAEGILRAAMVPGTHTYRIYTPNAPHRRLTSAMDPFTFVISPQATKLTFDSNYAVMTQESNRFIVGRSGRSARTPMINVPIVEGMVTPVSINIWQINAPPPSMPESEIRQRYSAQPLNFDLVIEVGQALPLAKVETLPSDAKRNCRYPQVTD